MDIFFGDIGKSLKSGFFWILRIVIVLVIIGVLVWFLLNLASGDLERAMIVLLGVIVGLLYIISDSLREIRDELRKQSR